MPANVGVWLEEETQLVLQRVEGAMTFEDFEQLDLLTAECVERLRDRDHVRILADGRKMLPASLKVRRAALDTLRPNVKRMALYGGQRFTQVVNLFFAIVAGNRIRSFATEEQARAWLLS